MCDEHENEMMTISANTKERFSREIWDKRGLSMCVINKSV